MPENTAHAHRFRSRGLGLREILAVIAVAAILLSLLLPTAAQLKDSSRRAMCADNMRRLMAGVHAYGDDHQGKGPLRGFFTYTVAETSQEAYGFGGNSIKVLINLGLLHGKYNGGDPNTLYCPATYATIRDLPMGWKSALNPSVTFTVGSRNYGIILAPRLTYPDFSGPEPFPQAMWSSQFVNWVNNTWKPQNPGKTFQVPNNPVLATDGYFGGLAPPHKPGINAMYMDGHVSYHDIGGNPFSNATAFDPWYKLSLKQ